MSRFRLALIPFLGAMGEKSELPVKSVLKFLQFGDEATQFANVSAELNPHLSDLFTQLLKVTANDILWHPHGKDARSGGAKLRATTCATLVHGRVLTV